MKTSQLVLAAAAAALLSIADAQTTFMPPVTAPARPFFIYDSHPTGSLEGSIVSIDIEGRTETWQLACPTANKACLAESYYPVNVTHMRGSVWAASNTATAGVTKFWQCDLGTGSDDAISNQGGWCSVTTTSGGSTKVGEKTAVDSCFVDVRSVIAEITGGLEKISYTGGGYPASYYLSVLDEMTKSCPPFTSAAPVETLGTAATTGNAATGASGSSSLPTETGTASGSAAPSGSAPPSGSGRMLASMPLACGAVVVMGIAALL
ncbi:hypothetical protein CkaCkLH20_12410 [Colletotrichum karsti]|uniref:Uncharacterized protein n=1 Tax=Colletotrichum karsti TaxID=1095194 RepID=A0A9P6HXF2_9PEZI|nr:uncharacterized protein CkaCkLH20_12410 [Colletotrichum karsti]KAF9870051.1 hypothetical protein CkaCkLH20_12410 [Colletotrichum karsti]